MVEKDPVQSVAVLGTGEAEFSTENYSDSTCFQYM